MTANPRRKASASCGCRVRRDDHEGGTALETPARAYGVLFRRARKPPAPTSKITLTLDGETVEEVLDYVQYNPKKLVRQLEIWVTKSVKAGKISLEEGKEFLSNYRSGLYGYTYLE